MIRRLYKRTTIIERTVIKVRVEYPLPMPGGSSGAEAAGDDSYTELSVDAREHKDCIETEKTGDGNIRLIGSSGDRGFIKK